MADGAINYWACEDEPALNQIKQIMPTSTPFWGRPSLLDQQNLDDTTSLTPSYAL